MVRILIRGVVLLESIVLLFEGKHCLPPFAQPLSVLTLPSCQQYSSKWVHLSAMRLIFLQSKQSTSGRMYLSTVRHNAIHDDRVCCLGGRSGMPGALFRSREVLAPRFCKMQQPFEYQITGLCCVHRQTLKICQRPRNRKPSLTWTLQNTTLLC